MVRKLNFNEYSVYIIVWTAMFAFPFILYSAATEIKGIHVVLEWLRIFPFFFLFLVNNHLLIPRLLEQNRKAQYVIAVVAVSAFSLALFNLENVALSLYGDIPEPLHRNHGIDGIYWFREFRNIQLEILLDRLLFCGLVIAFNIVVKYIFLQQERLREKEIEEKETLHTYVSFLKTQISPHFLMNTLNNIHYLIDYDPEKAKDAIILLSGLMRYILYDSQSKKIYISDEMKFTRTFLELMRMKTSERVAINVKIPDQLPDKQIPPLLFVSLLENAFKHGISLKEESYINVEFSFPDAEFMKCEIVNSNHARHDASQDHGIGLENTVKRLNLEYPSQYTLDIDENEKEYKVILIIPL